jgi:D-serine deaminase-like pyridoxal phosphate-dependent protein
MGAPDIDSAAVAALRDERVDWRFKGLPDRMFGRTVGDVASAGLDLFSGGFAGAVVVLDREALEHNLTTMADWSARRGLSLMPHGKTTMAPQLFARQLSLGAWGMTAANVSQARVYRAFGVRRIQLANELVDVGGIRWLAGELDRDPDFEFCCWVDSVAGVSLLTEAWPDVARPLDVLVDLGAPGARSGARDLAAATEVAGAVAASPALRLVGVAGYEGALGHGTSPDTLATLTAYVEDLRTLASELAFPDADEVIVSAGGSAYFDVVADVLGRPWARPTRPVLRSGAYVMHDEGYYRKVSALGAYPRITDAPPLRAAATAWAQVISRPEADLALLAMGKRDVPFDEGLPVPRQVRARDGRTSPLTGWRTGKVVDQHTFLVPGPDGDPLSVGDWVGFGLSHPCTTFDKWSLLPVVDGTTVVDLIRTYF